MSSSLTTQQKAARYDWLVENREKWFWLEDGGKWVRPSGQQYYLPGRFIYDGCSYSGLDFEEALNTIEKEKRKRFDGK